MKKILNFLSSQSTIILFSMGLGISLFLIVSFFLILINKPEIIIRDVNNDSFYYNLTIIGKFYIVSGIIPNFLFLIVILRIIKFFFILFLTILEKILRQIFTKKNIGIINKNIKNLEKNINLHKPKVESAVKKIKSKEIKDKHLTPLALIISAIIVATAILLQ